MAREQAEYVTALRQAVPYFVDNQICRLLEDVFGGIPDIPLLTELVPEPSGFVWLAHPLFLEEIHSHVFNGSHRLSLQALSWHKTHFNGGDGLRIFIYGQGRAYPLIFSSMIWRWGESRTSEAELKAKMALPTNQYPEFNKSQTLCRRWILAFLSFINQRLLVASPRHVTERSARRRIAKWGPDPPTVRVIVLRKQDRNRSSEPTPEEMNWSCQWVVRGHWRQHWFPSVRAHKALWIHPHVKGPENKPLKRPAADLFAVIR